MWRIFDPEESRVLPTKWVSRIREIYGNRTNNELDDDENPVARVQLHVDGNDGQLFVTPLLPFPEDDDTSYMDGGTTTPRTLFSNSSSEPDSGITCDDTPNRKRRRMKYGHDLVAQQLRAKRIENEQIRNLTSQLFSLQKTLLDLQEGTNRKYARVKESFKAMNHNLRKIAAQPVAVRRHKKRKSPSPSSTVDHAQVSPDSDVESDVDFSLLNQPKRRPNAVLFARPKSLHVLWQEYEKGIGGNVAAKNFTASERGYGSIRFTYSKRKVFWDFVIKFLNRDESASSVCCCSATTQSI